MNPNHLTINVRKQVSEAIKELKRIKNEENSCFKRIGKAFEKDEDTLEFFKKYYYPIQDEVDKNFNAFLEICVLEDKYEFASSYLGGSTLNKEGDTTIRIE